MKTRPNKPAAGNAGIASRLQSDALVGRVAELGSFGGFGRTMSEWRFKLLYDGQCPFCRVEARWLQRWNRHGHLVFEDISTSEFDPSRYGVTREDVMGIMHGVFPDGRIVRKVEAFRQAYRAVGLGWLLAPTGWPLLRWVFDGLYGLFARYRVSVGRLFGGSCCTTGKCDVAARAHKRDTHT